MDGPRFDLLARDLGAAPSRRRFLASVAIAAVAVLLPDLGPAAASRCRRVGGKCRTKRDCCSGMVCANRRCACRNEAERCGAGCCADCFVDRSASEPKEFCCPASKITPGEDPEDPDDDVCCYADQVRLQNRCCCDGCMGTVVCNGICCSGNSCCNGTCCQGAQVCARTSRNGRRRCVPADRGCTSRDDCFLGETCLRGTGEPEGQCCASGRICRRSNTLEPGPVCCPHGQYCDRSDGAENELCCPVGTLCATTRSIRFRR